MAGEAVKIDHLEIPEGAVIIVRDPEGEMPMDETDIFDGFVRELHERFPKSLVFWMAGDMTLETMPEDLLEALLNDLLAHKKAREDASG